MPHLTPGSQVSTPQGNTSHGIHKSASSLVSRVREVWKSTWPSRSHLQVGSFHTPPIRLP